MALLELIHGGVPTRLDFSLKPGGCQRGLIPCERHFPQNTARRPSGTVWCRHASATLDKDLPPKTSSTWFKGQRRPVETLWREFFSDPTQWWDNRSEKGTSSFPDFVRKNTREPLWVSGNSNPGWVEAQLAEMAPGTVPLSVFSWNKRLTRCVKAKQFQKALELFEQMQIHDLKPDRFTFVPVIHACAGLRALEEGKRVHLRVVLKRLESDVFIGSALVRMYAKCGCIEDAWKVFEKMPKRDVVVWTSIISGYVKCKQGQRALELSKQMQQEGVKPNAFTYVAMLSACASISALDEGKRVHEEIIHSGCESDLYVSNSLVDMYSKCGSIEDAWAVFNKLPTRNVVTWNAMIQGYVKCGQGQKALDLYRQMQREGMEPDNGIFVAVLNACATVGALEEGRRVHERIIETNSESDLYVGNSLLDMYAKCGTIDDAWRVFNKLPVRDAVTWGAMILGYVKCGQGEKGLELYQQMKREGVQPNSVAFLAAVNACASVLALDEGKRIHEDVVLNGMEFDVFVGSSLIDMYAKCGSIEDGRRLFDRMPSRTAVTWNSMIMGYVKCRQPETALKLYRQMQSGGVKPTQVTFVALLNACALIGALEEGRRIHEEIIECGYEAELFIGNSLIDMHGRCGSIKDARRVFDQMPTRNVISWSAIISAYVKHGQGKMGLELFSKMQQRKLQPDSATFVAALSACANLAALDEGRRVHDLIIQSGGEIDSFVGSAVVDMYVKCGSVEEAWIAFSNMPKPDVAAWGSMILGYAKSGQGELAFQLMRRMQQEGVEPNKFTFVAWLNACASVGALEEGRRVHEWIIRSDMETDVFICSSLVDMYSKCGSIDSSWKVFNKMGQHDVVACGAMIMGYVKCGLGRKALELWHQMQVEGTKPDSFIFVGLLNACASVTALEEGRKIHELIIESGCGSDIIVGNSLVDMYAKCGSMQDALQVFKSLPTHDVIAWSSLILGFVKFGQGKKALGLFRRMQKEKVEPNEFTFVAVLKACSTLEALDEGRDIHAQIIHRGLESDVFVGSGLLHMYSKCGCMEDAWRVFSKMPTRNQVTWTVIILGYFRRGQGDRALELFQQMLREGLEPSPATFVGMLNACANVGSLHDGKRVHELIIQSGCGSDPCMASSLVNMYAKCGSLEDAWEVFKTMSKPDVIAWDAMILGYLKCGQQHKAVELLQQMQHEGIEPNPTILGGVLNDAVDLAALPDGTPVHEQIR
ncbi:unnamed protein product [Calypogeia fissa]